MELPSKKEKPQCSSVPASVIELSTDSFHSMSPEPRLQALFPSRLVGDDISARLSLALKLNWDPTADWLLDTTAALYWRWVGNTQHMISCLKAAVHKAPSNLKDIPLHHVAHILLSLGHSREALVLGSLALKISPRSINAHVVLFQAYRAVGEPENAMKYEKATIALYEQSQAAASP